MEFIAFQNNDSDGDENDDIENQYGGGGDAHRQRSFKPPMDRQHHRETFVANQTYHLNVFQEQQNFTPFKPHTPSTKALFCESDPKRQTFNVQSYASLDFQINDYENEEDDPHSMIIEAAPKFKLPPALAARLKGYAKKKEIVKKDDGNIVAKSCRLDRRETMVVRPNKAKVRLNVHLKRMFQCVPHRFSS